MSEMTTTAPQRAPRTGLMPLARSRWYLFVRQRSTWVFLALGTALSLSATLFDTDELTGHPEFCVDYAAASMIFVGMASALVGASDVSPGNGAARAIASARPYRCLAADVLALACFALLFSTVLVAVLHVLMVVLIGSELLPEVGTIAFNWLWGVPLTNTAMMILAVLVGATLRGRVLACAIWFTLMYLCVVIFPILNNVWGIHNTIAVYTPNVLKHVAAMPFHVDPWWGDYISWHEAWGVIAVWIIALSATALLRLRLRGVTAAESSALR